VDNTLMQRELESVGAVLDHTAVAAPRIRDLLPIYQSILGGRFINGGDNTRVGYRAVQLEYRDGTKIELMEPLEGSTFFDTFRSGKGWGFHHVTFIVPDLRRAIAVVERAGITPIGVFFDDEYWSEAFLHPRDASGALVQLAVKGPRFLAIDWSTVTLEDVLAGRGGRGNGEPSP